MWGRERTGKSKQDAFPWPRDAAAIRRTIFEGRQQDYPEKARGCAEKREGPLLRSLAKGGFQVEQNRGRARKGVTARGYRHSSLGKGWRIFPQGPQGRGKNTARGQKKESIPTDKMESQRGKWNRSGLAPDMQRRRGGKVQTCKRSSK